MIFKCYLNNKNRQIFRKGVTNYNLGETKRLCLLNPIKKRRRENIFFLQLIPNENE